MHELLRVIEPPRTCSYLPLERESLEIRGIASLSSEEYADLLTRGYRRFGWMIFRPACAACRQCRSVRLLVPQFTLTASYRRILRKNENIRAELHPLFLTREHLDLHNRYQRFMNRHRDWPLQLINARSYREHYLSGASDLGRQWLYFDHDRLVGVALMDEVPNAISLTTFFYDPDWRHASPGTFSILTQLQYAKAKNLEFAYLGYWVEACRSLAYKGRFQPREILRDYPPDGVGPIWETG